MSTASPNRLRECLDCSRRAGRGTTVDDLAEELAPAYDVVTPAEAALAGNGMPVMILAVNGIQVVSLVIGALVIGVFFYITTLHKTGQIAAIKALGASNGFVYRQLLLQITLLVAVASAIGIGITLATGSSMPPTMAFDPQPERWAMALAAVFAMAYLGSLFSLKSILAIDPATALDRGEH
jgi:putative ABC transport system permease protein